MEVLVNSAGAAKRYLPEELNVEAWHAAMDAKYFTYIHAMDAVLPAMAKRGKGTVVNVIGMGGKAATPIHLPGGAANSALMLATVGLANVYGPMSIRINAINPGATLTERLQESLKLEAKTRGVSEDEVLLQRQAKIPLRRYAGSRGHREPYAVFGFGQGQLHHRHRGPDGRRVEPGAVTPAHPQVALVSSSLSGPVLKLRS